MVLITKAQRARLLANGRAQREAQERGEQLDPSPVVKLFTPDAQATWLLTELSPVDPNIAFGLCDLGMGFPELGYVSLTEISEIRGPLGLPVERDRFFTPKKSISEYATAAHIAGYILA